MESSQSDPEETSIPMTAGRTMNTLKTPLISPSDEPDDAILESAIMTRPTSPKYLKAEDEAIRKAAYTGNVRCAGGSRPVSPQASGRVSPSEDTALSRDTPRSDDASIRQRASRLSLRERYQIDSLEDLTERLVHMDHYEEYVRWRDGYARWRMGGSRGARGEIQRTVSVEVIDCERALPLIVVPALDPESSTTAWFRAVYPDFASFMFKRTLAYWATVSFIEGSALFTIGCISILIEETRRREITSALTLSPCILGGLWFLLGSYLGYLQQLNWELRRNREISLPAKPTAYYMFPWKLPKSKGMVGWQGYLYGCVAFGVAQWCSLIHWQTSVQRKCWVYFPMTLGAIGFVVAGVCEVRENRDGAWTLVWWVSWANLIGSVLFLIGSALPLYDPISPSVLFASNLPFAIGSLIFFVFSAASMFLWKNDMFGLTLSRKLTSISVQHCRPLSSNTITVNVVYIMSATLCSINVCLSIEHSRGEVSLVRQVSNIINSSLLFLLVHLLLILTSVITALPKTEPYRTLMLAIRFLCLYMLVGVTATFICLLRSTGPLTPVMSFFGGG